MRRKGEARLAAIAAAALTIFTRDGFAAAQVADIAREAGLSVGTLYLYAEGKQALFELAVGAALSGPEAAAAIDLALLPLRARGMAATADLIEAESRARHRWPLLAEALGAASAQPEAEIPAVVGELFDLMTRERAIIWLLDRCAWDEPRFRELFAERLRGRYFADLARFIETRRPDAATRPEHVAALTRAIVEMVAWMAIHRLRAPEPVPFDAAEARRACIALAAGGLAGAPALPRHRVPAPSRRSLL